MVGIVGLCHYIHLSYYSGYDYYMYYKVTPLAFHSSPLVSGDAAI